jgi:glycosyltransferase involved in cell wall biosynthesis
MNISQLNYIIVYLGRSPAGSKITKELFLGLKDAGVNKISLAYSSFNHYLDSFIINDNYSKIVTYESLWGLFLSFFRLISTTNKLINLEGNSCTNLYIFPMNTPLSIIMQVILTLKGKKTYCVIHDAVRHPGDSFRKITAVLTWFEIRFSYKLIFLTGDVMEKCIKHFGFNKSKAHLLFLPLFEYINITPRQFPSKRPLRLLFLGRIKAYKGLPLLLGARKLLNKKGILTDLTIAGDGLMPSEVSVSMDNISVINRLLEDFEIAKLLSDADVLVLPYIEASQSGIASTSCSASLPLIYTPVGGLSEQLSGYGAIGTSSVSALAISESVEALIGDPLLYEALSEKQYKIAKSLSWLTFARALIKIQ